MKLALVGYGRMGRMIERIAEERGHRIIARIDRDSETDITQLGQLGADVVIEFSQPAVAYANCLACIEQGLPVVSGTTGWAEGVEQLRALVRSRIGASFIWSSNFSVGVNLFLELNRRMARLMCHAPEYRISMSETHHIHKLDAPSGTAITLAEAILAERTDLTHWTEQQAPEDRHALPIASLREGEVPGIHSVTYRSAVDQITLTHEAYGRDGFALGAVIAAEYAATHTGVHTMADILGTL